MFAVTLGLAMNAGAAPKAKKPVGKDAPAASAVAVFDVDSSASTAAWLGKKVTGQHDGKLKIKSGALEVKDGAPVSGKFELDMASITVDDIKDADSNGKLVGHLKDADFFSVDKFPTSTLKIRSVKGLKAEAGKPTHEITGDLTIKGITKELTFPATISIKGDTLNANASIPVDRTLWDIRYGSGKFFPSIGDKAIYDVFTVDVKLAANKKK